jgi:heme A synthase
MIVTALASSSPDYSGAAHLAIGLVVVVLIVLSTLLAIKIGSMDPERRARTWRWARWVVGGIVLSIVVGAIVAVVVTN